MKKILLSFFSLAIMLTGCAEKPKSVGNGLPNTDGAFSIADTVLYAVKDTSYRVPLETGYGLSNLSGRLSAADEMITMIKIVPDASIDSLLGARIDSVEFRLSVNYRYDPPAGKLLYNVVELKTPWSQTTFTTDSVPFLVFGTTTVGVFNDSMNYASTVMALLDTSVIRRWAASYSDTNAARFNGFGIQLPLGVNNCMIGFSSYSGYSGFAPQLFIRYTKNGRRDSLSYFSGEDAFAAKTSVPASFAGLMVQGGFGIRSKLSFDLSSLVNKPIVNDAVMELTLDTVASKFGGFSPDTVTALLSISGTILDQSDSTIFVYGLRTAAANGQPPVYSFGVTNITDRWVRGVKENYGLTLRWAAEFGTVEKAVFYPATTAEAAKRPKLKITYSKK